MQQCVENCYQYGKIYKIESLIGGLVYYGATCDRLAKRLSRHKRPDNKTRSKLVLQYEDAKISLVEEFPCANKDELFARENHYIYNNPCVNRLGKSGIMAENRTEYSNKYYNLHKDRINAVRRARSPEKKRAIYERDRLTALKRKEYRGAQRCFTPHGV